MSSSREAMETPKWLFPFLEAKFSTSRGSNRDQKNLGYFCLDCMGNPLSRAEIIKHSDRDYLQVVKSSNEYAVRARDVVKRINCDKIHQFQVNSNNIFFLNSKKRKFNDNGRVEYGCKVCNHSLKKGSECCSLACKFMKAGESEDKGGSSKNEKQEIIAESRVMELGETSGMKVEVVRRCSSKRRKGIPRRAVISSGIFDLSFC